MKVSKLKFNPQNPRKITPSQLEKLINSINDFPKMMELRPVVYDPETMHVLGGNQRLKAIKEIGMKDIPDTWVKAANELTDEEKHRFVVQDNAEAGLWDLDALRDGWDVDEIEGWGVEIEGLDIIPANFSEKFSLPHGDKEPFQQMTFTLADVQAEQVKGALAIAKQDSDIETYGNENSNGNALFRIVKEWAEQRI